MLEGMAKPQTEITPPTKKFIKCTTDTAMKIKAVILITKELFISSSVYLS